VKVRVKKWTLMEIMTFWQGNKFAFGFFVFVMLVVEKELVNLVAWFFQKLQNELVVVQCKVGKSINTLFRPVLRIIGYYYQKRFTKVMYPQTP
jgi:hypothetical protein